MANGRPDDHDSIGDDLRVIEFLTEKPIYRHEAKGGDNDGPPRRRGLLVLALAAVAVAIVGVSVGVSVEVSRDDGDAEADPGNRGTSSASQTAGAVHDSTTVPPERMPRSLTPGDESTTAPLLPEGRPSTPEIGELVASVASVDFSGVAGAAYYLYADGRLIRTPDPAVEGSGFFEQRLAREGIDAVRERFFSSALFSYQSPGNISDCMDGLCVRSDAGGLVVAEGGAVTTTQGARLFSYLLTLAESLPESFWVAPELRPYIPARIAVCLQTFANVPDRAIPVPLDLSIVVPTFPARAAELVGRRAPIGTLPNPDPACFEMTLDEARTLADEFLSPAGGGTHQSSGIVISNRQLAAIQTEASEGIVAFVRFNPLLPHRESAAAFGG